MKISRTILAILATAATLFTLGAVNTARADVYTEPGGHIVNGRLWQTECSMYSTSVVRCRTEIWATQVKYVDGRYVRVTDWAFNNLTYLPSPRTQWADNPLGNPGEWTAADGRQWRTVCDTAETGSNACRSFVRARVASATATPSGWAYSVETKWVFNNLVVFSTGSRPPVTEVPPSVIETAKLSHTGYGPLQLGTSLVDLERLGYVQHNTSEVCDFWEVSGEVLDAGINMITFGDTLDIVMAVTEDVNTTLGTRVGHTFEQAQVTYDAADGFGPFHADVKDGYQPVYTYVVDQGPNEMIFMGSFEDTAQPDALDPIQMILVREADDALLWDGC
ncbi:hypothetical protein GCM10028820_20300 [Tessaracoccus terricola]